jgi:hypothetical protein
MDFHVGGWHGHIFFPLGVFFLALAVVTVAVLMRLAMRKRARKN